MEDVIVTDQWTLESDVPLIEARGFVRLTEPYAEHELWMMEKACCQLRRRRGVEFRIVATEGGFHVLYVKPRHTIVNEGEKL